MVYSKTKPFAFNVFFKGSKRIEQLKKAGAPVDVSASAIESVLSSALDALIGRGLVDEQDNLFRMKPAELGIIQYYANSILHWK